MKKLLKTIACLYAGIAAASALDVKFNGEQSVPGCDYIKFDISTCEDAIKINKVSIDDSQLGKNGKIEYATLIVPGKAQGKQVCVSKRAFKKLKSDHLRLKLKFEAVEEKGSNDKNSAIFYVKFPCNCSHMFDSSESITNIDLKGVDSKYVTDAKGMFANCLDLEGIEFGNFDTSEIRSMDTMFYRCKSLKTLDLKEFCTQNVENMSFMFALCENLTNLTFGDHFDTSNVTEMSLMFLSCEKLAMIDFIGGKGIHNFNPNFG